MNLARNQDGTFSLTGISETQLSALKNVLKPSVQGYEHIKDLTFAQRKEVYRQTYGEPTEANSELKKTFQLQVEFGKVCAEILEAIEPNEVKEAKVVKM
jgi:hypothetical protein